MSREFRWVGSNYFHAALKEAVEERGTHEVSQALAALYAALANVEHGSASYEANDSGFAEPYIALTKGLGEIVRAVDALKEIDTRVTRLVSDMIRRRVDLKDEP